MCMGGGGGGGGGDGGAAAARAREEARQNSIRQGMANIDSAFSGFNDAFYDTRAKAYRDYATPQLEDQWGKAMRDLTYSLSRSGNLNSSLAGEKQAEAKQLYDRRKQEMESTALGYANQARKDVASNRSELVSELNATADPAAASNAAQARAATMNIMPVFSPLGQLFAGLTDNLQTYQAAKQAKALNDVMGATLFTPRASGSQYIV